MPSVLTVPVGATSHQFWKMPSCSLSTFAITVTEPSAAARSFIPCNGLRVILRTIPMPGTTIAGLRSIPTPGEGKRREGSGHEIVPPAKLPSLAPDRILVMNPLYRDEVESTVRALGLSCPVTAIDTLLDEAVHG